METITKLKKLPLKNATHVHINFDGTLTINYKEKHKVSGKDIDWQLTILKEEVPFRLVLQKRDYVFRSVLIDTRVLPLLNELESVELWPDNTFKEQEYQLKTVVFNLKNKASISFNEYSINGKRLTNFEVSILQ